MDVADGEGDASETHDELAVAIDAHDIALDALEGAGGDALFVVAMGVVGQGLVEELDAAGDGLDEAHEEGYVVVAHRVAGILIELGDVVLRDHGGWGCCLRCRAHGIFLFPE